MFDVENFRAAVGVPKIGFHHLARGDHVRNAGRDSKVVLKDCVAVVRSDEIGPADRDPCAVGCREAAHFNAVLRAAANYISRDNAVGDDPGVVVDVFEKEIQGTQPLIEPVSMCRHSACARRRGTQSIGIMRSVAASSP